MADEQNDQQGERKQFKLDGSEGVGSTVLLTLTTKDAVSGFKEETFHIPAALVNFSSLNLAFAYKLIQGFSVQHQDDVVPE